MIFDTQRWGTDWMDTCLSLFGSLSQCYNFTSSDSPGYASPRRSACIYSRIKMNKLMAVADGPVAWLRMPAALAPQPLSSLIKLETRPPVHCLTTRWTRLRDCLASGRCVMTRQRAVWRCEHVTISVVTHARHNSTSTDWPSSSSVTRTWWWFIGIHWSTFKRMVLKRLTDANKIYIIATLRPELTV